MQPRAIFLKNLRCFAGRHRIELRPLTLVYGENNVGKSVLLRAIKLLADTVASLDEPLALGSPVARGASFDQLRCRLEDPHWYDEPADGPQYGDPAIGLGLEWQNGPLREATFEWVGHGRSDQIAVPVLSRLELEGPEVARLRFQRRRIRSDTDRGRYSIGCEIDDGHLEPRIQDKISFDGPFPVAPDIPRLAAAQSHLRAWARSVDWLSADRRPQLMGLIQPKGGHTRLKAQGRNVLDILTQREDVNRWLNERASELRSEAELVFEAGQSGSITGLVPAVTIRVTADAVAPEWYAMARCGCRRTQLRGVSSAASAVHGKLRTAAVTESVGKSQEFGHEAARTATHVDQVLQYASQTAASLPSATGVGKRSQEWPYSPRL